MKIIFPLLSGFFALGIAEARAESDESPPRIEVAVQRNNDKEWAKDGDYDDKAQVIQVRIVIDNRDFRELKEMKARVSFVGELMDDDLRRSGDEAFAVIHRQIIPFDLKDSIDSVLETRKFVVRFDESRSARFGARYEGAVVCILDPDGKVVLLESDKAFLRKYAEEIDQFKELVAFDKKGEPLPEIKHTVRIDTP